MTPVDPSPDLNGLAAAARTGDRAALARLLTQVRPPVYRYVLARLADHGLAEDVAQEVVITVMTALPGYVDTGRPVLAWVFGIAANKLREAHRHRARHAEVAVDAIPERPQDDERGDPAAGRARGAQITEVAS